MSDTHGGDGTDGGLLRHWPRGTRSLAVVVSDAPVVRRVTAERDAATVAALQAYLRDSGTPTGPEVDVRL